MVMPSTGTTSREAVDPGLDPATDVDDSMPLWTGAGGDLAGVLGPGLEPPDIAFKLLVL